MLECGECNPQHREEPIWISHLLCRQTELQQQQQCMEERSNEWNKYAERMREMIHHRRRPAAPAASRRSIISVICNLFLHTRKELAHICVELQAQECCKQSKNCRYLITKAPSETHLCNWQWTCQSLCHFDWTLWPNKCGFAFFKFSMLHINMKNAIPELLD